MKRRTVAIDRLGCAIAGGVLVAVGTTAAAWAHGDLRVPGDGALRAPWLPDVVNAGWWPVALGAAGLLLIAIGLAWLVSHRPGQTVGSVALPGASGAGSITVDLNTAATAAASALARQPHIAGATGTSLVDRGQRVIELHVEIEPSADALSAASTALDVTRRDLAAALDGVAIGAPIATRILLRTPRVPRGANRVA